MSADHKAIIHTKAFCSNLREQHLRLLDSARKESSRNFELSCLSVEELERLDAVTIVEVWTDSKGRRHVRRF